MELKDLENIAILCKTKDEAERCYALADSHGWVWRSGSNWINEIYWIFRTKENCYDLYECCFSPKCYFEENGYTIKPASWFLDNFKIKDMEERNIKLSLTTAKEWYKGSDETLKKLALQAYKEEELKEVKTWEDLISIQECKVGYYIAADSGIIKGTQMLTNHDKNLFIDKKHVKSALAMAQISQLIPYFGGEITEEEWNNINIPKYRLGKVKNEIIEDITFAHYSLLSFHTPEQRDEFLKYNEQLVKDYLMID